jgi:hypothetical protein
MRLFNKFRDRTPNDLPAGLLPSLARAHSVREMRDLLTGAVLAGGGLAIAFDGEAAISESDGLTRRQQSLVELVAAYGYRVKFRSAK